MSRLLAAQRALTLPGWIKEDLSRKAQAIPLLDLRFAEGKSLVDATTGANLVTFTRASSGTFVGSNGVLQTATTNLQTWSEDFRNTADAGATRPWVYNTSAVTADNTAAPNGTNTADLIAGAAGTANKFLSNNISTTVTGFYTFSIYLKQNTEQFVVVRLSDGSANGIRGRFNLTAGTVVITNEGTATGQAASATAVGNGWYRCVVTCSVSSLPSSVMQPQLWLNNFASTSLTTNYLAWGAQLEQSATVGEYIPTTSTINSVPRFDHNPTTGESLGLLVEEQRTNLALRSEEFNDANWVKTGLTVTANSDASPDGQATADTLTISSSNQSIYQSATVTASTSYTGSVYVKLGTLIAANYKIAVYDNTNAAFIVTDVVPAQTPTSTGWTRISYTFTTPATCTSVRWYPYRNSASVSGTVFAWGAQLEAGAFPTSYIPTTAATATRSADVASITGTNFSSWYRQDEGTVFADADRNTAITATTTVVSINDNTANNRLFNFRQDSASQLTVISQTGGNLDASPQVSLINTSARNKVAAAQALNNLAASANGGTAVADSSVAIPTVNQMQIGNVTNVSVYNGTIRRLTYWPVRLGNNVLQQITQ